MSDILNPAIEDQLMVNGVPTIQFYTWVADITEAVNNLEPLIGTGTPEGSVEASPYRWYVDTSAAVGAGIYFKESGYGNTGWVLRS